MTELKVNLCNVSSDVLGMGIGLKEQVKRISESIEEHIDQIKHELVDRMRITSLVACYNEFPNIQAEVDKLRDERKRLLDEKTKLEDRIKAIDTDIDNKIKSYDVKKDEAVKASKSGMYSITDDKIVLEFQKLILNKK